MRPSYRNAPDRILGLVCRCLGTVVVLVCLAALTPLPNYLARALRLEPRLEAAEAIVVLGGGVQPDGALSSESLPRVMQGIRLYKASLAPPLVVCLALTSLAGYWLGRRALGFEHASLGSVLRNTLECLGASVIFLVANVLLGALVALAMRTLTNHFVGLYVFSDAILLPLSLLQ